MSTSTFVFCHFDHHDDRDVVPEHWQRKHLLLGERLLQCSKCDDYFYHQTHVCSVLDMGSQLDLSIRQYNDFLALGTFPFDFVFYSHSDYDYVSSYVLKGTYVSLRESL